MTGRQTTSLDFNQVARMDQVTFWNPLPGTEALPADARQRLRESDTDIRQNRLESALDASLAVNAIAPEYIPAFVRTSELLVATQRRDRARSLAEMITAHQEALEKDDFAYQLARLSAHADPSTEKTLRVAWATLERQNGSLMTPYVPAAIGALADAGRGDEAVDLAETWQQAQPDSALAIAYLVREYLREGRGEEAARVVQSFREGYDADRSWPENIVVSTVLSIAREDEPNWMTAGPVCRALRAKSLDYRSVTSLLEFLVPAIENPHRTLILAGLIALAAGDHSEAEAIFQTIEPGDQVESYLTGIGLYRACHAPQDGQSRIRTLRDTYKTFDDSQTCELADSSEIFDPPATRREVGLELATALQEMEDESASLDILSNLVNHYPGDSEILRRQAEIMGKSGSRTDAIRQLEQLASQQEKERKYETAIRTLESMIRLNPGNITLRSRVVENCLKIGQFNKAIDQLVMQGRLLHRAGKFQDAEPPVHRAIEIATMIGDWDKVTKLYRLLMGFDPEATRLRHSAVATYVQHGRTDEALVQLKEIARIARKNGDPDEAIAASHQMLALNPSDPVTYHQLGELLVSIEEYGQADRVYRRLAALAPDDPAVKAKRSALAAMAKNSHQNG